MKIEEELVGLSVHSRYFKIHYIEQDLPNQAELSDRYFSFILYCWDWMVTLFEEYEC